jgi:hypothetical protein
MIRRLEFTSLVSATLKTFKIGVIPCGARYDAICHNDLHFCHESLLLVKARVHINFMTPRDATVQIRREFLPTIVAVMQQKLAV